MKKKFKQNKKKKKVTPSVYVCVWSVRWCCAMWRFEKIRLDILFFRRSKITSIECFFLDNAIHFVFRNIFRTAMCSVHNKFYELKISKFSEIFQQNTSIFAR